MISDPEDRERRSLLHALRDSTLPRLISKDVQAMEMLIYDFFSGFEEAKNYIISSLKVCTNIIHFQVPLYTSFLFHTNFAKSLFRATLSLLQSRCPYSPTQTSWTSAFTSTTHSWSVMGSCYWGQQVVVKVQSSSYSRWPSTRYTETSTGRKSGEDWEISH